mmetsp:Transcript_617/g.1933  ORF Transcript_617/g.1933 Transcript_617/m.1933 type:complete len:238 (+) Transcript_617:1169-1882(+)
MLASAPESAYTTLVVRRPQRHREREREERRDEGECLSLFWPRTPPRGALQRHGARVRGHWGRREEGSEQNPEGSRQVRSGAPSRRASGPHRQGPQGRRRPRLGRNADRPRPELPPRPERGGRGLLLLHAHRISDGPWCPEEGRARHGRPRPGQGPGGDGSGAEGDRGALELDGPAGRARHRVRGLRRDHAQPDVRPGDGRRGGGRAARGRGRRELRRRIPARLRQGNRAGVRQRGPH